MFGWMTERRRNRLLESEFPAAWTEILERNVGAYRLLDEDEQARLRDLVQVFVAEKNFEGCGGLELDDEIRITVAGTGCLMLLGRDHDLFSEVESILIYPSAVVATEGKRSTFDSSARVVEDRTVLGLAVKGGAVVLAWDSALQGARDARDGRNVVIHELAHKIDFLDGDADGTPELETHAQMQAWAAAFAPAFLAQKERAAKGKKSLLDDYAITNEAEYFAVASEVFFEKPRALAKQLPAVYRSLADFFKLDLAAREEAAAAKPPKKTAAKPATKAKTKHDATKPAAKGKHGDAKPATKATPGAPKHPPSEQPSDPPRFRKTAAMAAVSLPLDAPVATAKSPPTKAAPAPTKPSPANAKATPAPTKPSPANAKATPAPTKPSPANAKATPAPKAAVASAPTKPAAATTASAAPRRKSTAMAAVVPPADEPAPPPRFRKTAAMSVVSLPEDD